MDFDFSTFDSIDDNFSSQDFFSEEGLGGTTEISGDNLSRSYAAPLRIFHRLLMFWNDSDNGLSGVFDNDNNYLSNDNIIPDFDSWAEIDHGTPIEDSLVWHEQTTPFTCGVVSSEMIMNMFGLEISEAELVFQATSEGLLTENGMSIEGIQQLLESNGIETHIGHGDINNLAQEFEAGHKIVIPLDSGEIWKNDSQWEDLIDERADHAVVLTGIDLDSIPPKVYLNDPGHPDGQAMAVDMDLFIDSWNDSGNQYLATNQKPV